MTIRKTCCGGLVDVDGVVWPHAIQSIATTARAARCFIQSEIYRVGFSGSSKADDRHLAPGTYLFDVWVREAGNTPDWETHISPNPTFTLSQPSPAARIAGCCGDHCRVLRLRCDCDGA